MFVVRLAVLGQTLAAGGALQQARAQACLQSRQALANRRACEIQAFGGLGQVATFDDLQKQLNAIKTRCGHGSIVAP